MEAAQAQKTFPETFPETFPSTIPRINKPGWFKSSEKYAIAAGDIMISYDELWKTHSEKPPAYLRPHPGGPPGRGLVPDGS